MLKTTNNIKIRYNRFSKKTRFIPVNMKTFNFEKGLISVDLPKLYFINKTVDENEEVYNIILEMYISYLNGSFNFLDNFLFDELIPDYKTERLLDILNATQNTKYGMKELKNIFKLNNQDNKELHFFVRKSRDNFSLLLIDLYHLGVYGERVVKGKVIPISIKSIYKSKQHNNCCLEKIKELS